MLTRLVRHEESDQQVDQFLPSSASYAYLYTFPVQGRQLGADMLARLVRHEEAHAALLAGGWPRRAARYAAAHGLQPPPDAPLPVLHPLAV